MKDSCGQGFCDQRATSTCNGCLTPVAVGGGQIQWEWSGSEGQGASPRLMSAIVASV